VYRGPPRAERRDHLRPLRHRGRAPRRAPFADAAEAFGSGSTADADHDVGLVFLDAPIYLDAYPQIASSPLQDGDQVVSVGRSLDGQLSGSVCYASPPITVESAPDGDYAASSPLDPGDAGGPDFVLDTHTIVAVNADGAGGTPLLARVDPLYGWITQQVAAYGSGGDQGYPGDPGYPGYPGYPGGPGDGHGNGHGGGQGDGHGGGQGNGHGGGQGDGHGGGQGGGHGCPGGGHH
jgi:hypothetical protein